MDQQLSMNCRVIGSTPWKKHSNPDTTGAAPLTSSNQVALVSDLLSINKAINPVKNHASSSMCVTYENVVLLQDFALTVSTRMSDREEASHLQ